MKPIKLYWCREKGRDNPEKQNFGDYLSPLLVERLAGRKVEYAPIHKADLVAIGSVLERERKAKHWGIVPRKLHIWGTGSGVPDISFSGRHHYHAVRGALTLAQITSPSSVPALGDPGLLAPLLLEQASYSKKYSIGLIPHYADMNEPAVAKLLASPLNIHLINVFSPVKQVLEEIASCDFILSSSMHGLIVADAFKVPNKWLLFSEGRISQYKFHDYYTIFDIFDQKPALPEQILNNSKIIKEIIENYRRPHIEMRKEALINSFPSL
ncbi:MAG: polysaccharide pyruvyl transferase family protein [Desulfuromonadaceae bacterium]|nr:polysaccharide pyruvyl transferase family protein [Desulfuromonadaceae bacterium]